MSKDEIEGRRTLQTLRASCKDSQDGEIHALTAKTAPIEGAVFANGLSKAS